MKPISDITAPTPQHQAPALNYTDHMTPVDWFASSALEGMLSAGAFPHEGQTIANYAYQIAEAMVAARQNFFQANPQYHPDTIEEARAAAWEEKRTATAKLRREKRSAAAKKGKAKRKADSTATALDDVPSESAE